MPLRLMCVTAHPDDECFAFGGALALAAERGIETYVVCMTDGQAASSRGDTASGAELGAMRRAEFAASCKVLGVTRYELLNHHDAQLIHVPFPEPAAQLVERIRTFRPNVVVTFGGDGGANSHSDHMMVSFWTTAAFHWSAQPKRFPEISPAFQPDRLFYQTTRFFIPDRQPPHPMPWTVTLDIRSVQKRKSEAFEQHISQTPLIERTRGYFAKHGAEEYYALVATNDAQPAHLGTDLFEGLL
ncbi:PIG-L deacetylase family protein [Edaphobacter flagellatus]|uniref:PIG-L deacetylase family protein n=1 Tax=Edaphobacter flagellatus TaxID=1933044 RepID=UPI0021B394B0|nr:PIG-L family deacetylase [Edaphobacter flagellatus]